MTTAALSAALATIQPVFTDAERLALAGFLAGYRGLTREAYALDLRQFASWCRDPVAGPVRRPPRRHRVLRPRPGSRAGPGPRSPGGCPPSPGSTSTPSRRNSWTAPRPRMSAVRGWTTSRTPSRWTATSSARCWSPPGSARRRARADLPARPQRAAGIGGDRRGHRAPGPGARPPDPDHHPQGRQGRHHPARPAHRPGDRPGHRRAHRRAAVPRRGRAAAGPARRRPDRPPGRPPRRDRQDVRPAHAAARVHHRRARRRGAAARRAGGRIARRPADHDALRPGPRQPGPARHLHRRHLHRRRRSVNPGR